MDTLTIKNARFFCGRLAVQLTFKHNVYNSRVSENNTSLINTRKLFSRLKK